MADLITDILVIGNGFDLAHGLPTTYGNFLEFVKALEEFNASGQNKFCSYFKQLQEEKPDVLAELTECIYQNCWYFFFERIFNERRVEGKVGWIDFESEISIIIQALDDARHSFIMQVKNGVRGNNFKMNQSQIDIICSVFDKEVQSHNAEAASFEFDTINKRKERLIKDLMRLTRCLEIYLSDFVEKRIVDCLPIQIIYNLENIDGVISFNYTDTFEQIYREQFPDVKFDYIHGKARIDSNIDDCNLVLGIDEYLQGEQKDNDNEFIQFKKFFQRIYKKTGSCYIDWINNYEALNGAYDRPNLNIYIFGHSLDVTDADIFRRLILTDRATTHIFYHNQDALNKYIANLVKIIGEDRLIQFTGGSNGKIKFIPTS